MNNGSSNRGAFILPKGHELLWYEVVDVLGQGGFGVTYLAHDKNLGRSVALKEYLPQTYAARHTDMSVEPIDTESAELYQWGLTSFMNEARTLARFRHNNIVRVHSVFEHHNTAYMAMEYEVGESLATLMKNGSLPDDQAFYSSLLMPIIDGLRLVHDAGFLHRDIKPSNIYIREDTSPVLIDFGSSRETTQTDTGDLTVLVSQGYTPIEQYSKGYGQQGPWTDIYALASSVYYACTGVRLMDSLERNALIQRGLQDPAKPFSVAAKSIYSTEFAAAIDAALSIRLEDRPQSLEAWKLMFELPNDATVLRPVAAPTSAIDQTTTRNPASTVSSTTSNNPTSTVKPAPIAAPSPATDLIQTLDSLSSNDSATDVSHDELIINDSNPTHDWDVQEIRGDNATAPEKPSSKIFWIAGLGLCSVLALGIMFMLKPIGDRETDDGLAPESSVVAQALSVDSLPRPSAALIIESPVDILQDEINRLSTQMSDYMQSLKLAPESEAATKGINDVLERLQALASSPLIESHRQLREALLQTLLLSGEAGAKNQATIDKLIEAQLSDRTLNQISESLELPSKTATQRTALLYELVSLTRSERDELAKLSAFATLMKNIKAEIATRLQQNDFAIGARMLELTLLISPTDNELTAIKAHLELTRQ